LAPEKNLTLKEKATQLPARPGIYFFLNKAHQIIYIGKARNLKDRVKSYFLPTDDPKVHHILQEAADLDYLVTDNEKETAFLENNFIRRFQPKFNLRLKDDKSFPLIKINLAEEFPSITLTRRVENDGARYFGPFHPAHQARRTIELIAKYFHLRTCSGPLPPGRKRPCLEYDLGMCSAPCTQLISRENYQENVQNALLFLEGNSQLLLPILEKKMKKAAEALEFELAARWRDLIYTVKSLQQKPKTSLPSFDNADIIGWAKAGSTAALFAFFLRRGKVIESTSVLGESHPSEDKEQTLIRLLQTLYASREEIPERIYLPFPLKGKSSFDSYFLQEKKVKVKLIYPRQEKFKGILRLANLNAASELKKKVASPDLLSLLMKTLHLSSLPRRIEAIDISNTGGLESVGSLVVFEEGRPLKSAYRRYRIRSVIGPNDIASLQEVIRRRYTRLLGEKKQLPDLILVDGGLGQLQATQSVLRQLGLDFIPVIALAKKKETLYTTNFKHGLNLDPTSPVLKLLQWIRDEAHRFALALHRKRRQKQSFSSFLDGIPGIGPRRKLLLLHHFPDLTSLRQVDFQAVAELIGQQAARNLFKHLQQEESSQ
jgi:excinuclease ABC subunit C